MTRDEFHNSIRQAALTDKTLLSVVFKARLDRELPYRQITIRPVELRGERHLQFSYLTEKQDFIKNYAGDESAQKLDEVLAAAYGSVLFQTTEQQVNVQITTKGKVIAHRPQTEIKSEISTAHDHEKQVPLPVGKADKFLIEVGIMDAAGRIRPAMHAKYAQINAFLTLLEQTGELGSFARSPLEILDCGCGSAYLSFAAYHYLNNIKHIPARLTGIDYNDGLIAKDNQSAQALSYAGACFVKSTIIAYQPETPPDILLALHACDTATDEAIAQGIKAESRLILCSPCCHHAMRAELDALPTPAPFEPMLRHGIVKQRMAELLTDSFRALILRIMGYRTDIVEFVSPEHTDKNMLIRAVRRPGVDRAAAAAEYGTLKAFWGVTPTLETLLGDAFHAALRETVA